MTTKELQKRGAKHEWLRVSQTEDGSFYVESAEGKILYRVISMIAWAGLSSLFSICFWTNSSLLDTSEHPTANANTEKMNIK